MTTMNHNPYVQDILSQPQALRAALQGYPSQALKSLAADLLNAKN